MTHSALKAGQIGRISRIGAKQLAILLIAAVATASIGVVSSPGPIGLAFLAAGSGLAAAFVLLTGSKLLARLKMGNVAATIADFVENDASPSFIVNDDGEVLRMNGAARSAYSANVGDTLTGAFRNTFANAGGLIFRLKTKAQNGSVAAEDLVTRQGHLRVAVHPMERKTYLWRLEPIGRGGMNGQGSDGLSLPMLIIGRSRTILHMNEAARELLGGRVKSLDRVFTDLPVESGALAEATTAQGKAKVVVSEVEAGVGRTALYLLPAPGPEAENSRLFFNELPVALVKVAPDGVVRSFNKEAANLVGRALVNGAHLSDVMEGLGRPLSDWLAETIGGRAVQTTEFMRLRGDDSEVFVQVALNRITDDGEPAIIAVLSDATELKTLEAQFVQSQKMQAIGQLAGGVAHDFNNLLTAISGHCDLLLLRHDQGDADYSDLVQINQNANRAAALVGQLLAFSRKQTLRPEVLDMRDTLSDLTHLLNRLVGEKVRLNLSQDTTLQTIRADKRQLEQVLMNLVVNARDAMPNGGEIRIETESVNLTEPLDRDRVTVPEGQYVCVRVIDDGVGIPHDKLQKVFEPFYTTKRTGEGTGLGLSTAYGIVKQTGGFIFVDSELGSGTQFTLMFPVLEEQSAPLSEPVITYDAPAPKHGDGVILLVEDEAPVRAFASRALRLRGYTVLEADSAEAALKTLEDESLSVDLFVTDVVMPGKDGPSWVREALKDRPDVRVVFVSGYAEDRLTKDQASIPNSVFLPKPFSLNDLADTVHQQLH